jgi:small subunit ribosomal protein S20
MPNIKSAEKRVRQTEKSTATNKIKRSRITTARSKLAAAIHNADKEQAQAALKGFSSALDKAVKGGVIKANKADRSKARATKAVAKL